MRCPECKAQSDEAASYGDQHKRFLCSNSVCPVREFTGSGRVISLDETSPMQDEVEHGPYLQI